MQFDGEKYIKILESMNRKRTVMLHTSLSVQSVVEIF
jgi:hypothetical protein